MTRTARILASRFLAPTSRSARSISLMSLSCRASFQTVLPFKSLTEAPFSRGLVLGRPALAALLVQLGEHLRVRLAELHELLVDALQVLMVPLFQPAHLVGVALLEVGDVECVLGLHGAQRFGVLLSIPCVRPQQVDDDQDEDTVDTGLRKEGDQSRVHSVVPPSIRRSCAAASP